MKGKDLAILRSFPPTGQSPLLGEEEPKGSNQIGTTDTLGISSEPTFAGLRKNKKKKTRGPKKRGPQKKGKRGSAYLGVSILQPHACAQRFRLQILRRTRSNAGRVLGASQVEYKPFGKLPLEIPGMQGFPGETLH